MKPSKALSVFGNPVAFYPGLVPITGSIKATLMFCQIFYWHDKTSNPLGVYKSVSDFESEIHLTYKEQIAARKKLVELGLLIESYDRAEHRVYFSIDLDALDDLVYQQELAHDQKATAKKEGGTCQKVSYHLTKSHIGNTEITAKTTTRTTKADYSALFDMFWKAYPKKTGKDQAQKSFDKRKPDDKLLREMLVAIGKQRSTDQWQRDNGQYIPNPSTWLNQGRWMDEAIGGDSGPSNAFAGAI